MLNATFVGHTSPYAAARVDVPFLVVDVARRVDGRWTVAECDQEAGHAGIVPLALWSAIVTFDRE